LIQLYKTGLEPAVGHRLSIWVCQNDSYSETVNSPLMWQIQIFGKDIHKPNLNARRN